ncbi:MAG: type II secretion system minor pseudopilin GspK [Candidatus Hydrogenedentes bacterium]|nr:type II secretion system minor pseudopilin GspK [Candidatus Hydrogenedentota bacterium]
MRNRGPHHNRKRDEGVALLLTLLFVVLLTALVVEYVYETQVETAVVDAHLRDFEAMTAAKSGVMAGLSLVVADTFALPGQTVADGGAASLSGATGESISGGIAYDSLDEPWAYGVPFQPFNDAVMECSISDEYGKLNLNALFNTRSETGDADLALEQTLRYLFTERGADEDVTDAILDWLDPDDDPRPLGAEYDYYQSLETPYTCKNGPMTSVEELLLVRGMTPELYFGDPALEQLPLPELLTTNGHTSGRINLNTAQYELLLALGEAIGMPGLADIAIQERELSPFVSIEDIESRGVVPTEAENEEGETEQVRPFVVNSNVFRIRGNGLSGDGRVRIEVLLWRDAQLGPEGFRILQWRELR